MRPCQSSPPPSRPLPTRRPSAKTLAALRPISVLLIDDEPPTARAAQRLLSVDPSITVHLCFDPTAAPALAEQLAPTVILQDMVMPRCDGISLLRTLRSSPLTRDVPVIFLSSEDDPSTKAAAFASGADDYMVKFPDPIEMIARIRHHATHHVRGVEHDRAVGALEDSHGALEQQRRFLRETFERYLSRPVAERLLASPDGLELGGETRRVTILMTDLRGFTPLAERLEPQQMVTLINNYLDVMTGILVRHGGTIDEFIGDAILALFGAPEQRPDDAERAVACAVEMQLAMAEVNAKNRAAGLPEVEMGIGLNTGDVAVGNIGSKTRAKYGVVGSAVNRAARIESYTTGGQVLISDSTLEAAGGSIVVDEAIEVSPKGVSQPIRLHRVGGVRGRYRLMLSSASLALSAPVVDLEVVSVVLDGKDASGEVERGRVVALSREGAEIVYAAPPARLANLKLDVVTPAGDLLVDGLYAKVIGRGSHPGTSVVRFTSLPPGAAAALDTLSVGTGGLR